MLYKSILDNITLDDAKNLIQLYQELETRLRSTIYTQNREIETLELALQNKTDIMKDTKRYLDKTNELWEFENNLEHKYKNACGKENKKEIDDEGEWKYV